LVVAADTHVVGREDELALLREFVSALAQGPCAMCIRGEPGIGKTTLWRAAIEAGNAAAVVVLHARCVEAELPLAFVGLSDLVQNGFDTVADELPDHDRAALAVAVGLEAPNESRGDAIAVPRAFSALLRLLARDRPVLVAVDDVQWLDVPSRRALAFAARRLGDASIGILVTQRGDGRDPLDLARAFDETRFGEIRLDALSLGALAHLIRTRLDVRIPRPALARVHEASGGNPMFALEFARSLAHRSGPQLAPLPIPTSLQELVQARAAEQPQEIRRLLSVAAAAERPTPSLLAAIDAESPRLLDAAIDLGVVALGEDGVVRFTHPLLASAAYGELAPSERRALHAELAGVSQELEERARHLALASTEPDADAAAVLDEAAARAHARGAPETAAELAQEAVRLTPQTDVVRAGDRELAVAPYLADAGQTADACRWLDRLLAGDLQGPRRTRALLFRVGVEHDVEAGFGMIVEALDHAGEEPSLRAAVLLRLSSAQRYRGELAASEEAARQALASAEEGEDPALLALALALVADRAHVSGNPHRELMDRALALAAVHGTPPLAPTVRCLLGEQLLRDGDLHGARDVLEGELHAVVGTGILPARGRILRDLTDVESNAGDWQLATRYLDDALEDAIDGDDRWGEAELLARKARLAAMRGDVDAARRLVAEGTARAEAMHWPHLGAMNRWLLGFLELSLGEPARAWPALCDVARTPAAGGLEIVNALADAAETRAALGELEAVDELVAVLDDEARRGHRWAGPAALRSRGLCLLAQGDALQAAALAGDAARAFDAAGFPLDHGRALLVAGEAFRRAGERRRAAEMLEPAAAIFAGLGAALWQQRAHKELRRARPRPRHDRELTNAERQVAALVAAGKANREVAAQLFTTVATVEAHLTRIYRKLGLRSRTELARRVADGTVSLAEE
jgi:DNA-binding CsgD family transcriptional regulator/tetratricopeptide (TPR) repeat protein